MIKKIIKKEVVEKIEYEYCCEIMKNARQASVFCPDDSLGWVLWVSYPHTNGLSQRVKINFCPFCGANIYKK